MRIKYDGNPSLTGLLTLVLLSLAPILGQSQTVLRGIVRDRDSQQALISATVEFGGAFTLTDLEGGFELVPDGDRTVLTVRYIGYDVYIDTLGIGYPNYMEIYLEPDQNLLQQITVTSGKFETSLGESTASIEVIQTGLIESNNTTSVDEILDKVPGVNVLDGQANIRGGSGYSYGAGSRVMMLVDDIPALQADAGFPNWDDYPVESLAQIEVVKGSSSALHGSAAINGVINMRTAYATSEPRTKASVFYTNYRSPQDPDKQWWDQAPNEFGGSFSDARKLGKLDLVWGGYYIKRKSFKQEDFDDYGRANLNLRYRLDPRWTLGIAGNFNRGSSRNFFYWRDAQEGAYIGTPGNVNVSKRTRYTIDPSVRYTGQGGTKHELKTRLHRIRNDNSDGRGIMTNSYYGEYQFLKRFEEADFAITAGVVATHANVDAELYGDTVFQTNNWALYAQLEKKLFDRLTLQVGGRWENNSIVGPSVVSGVSIPDNAVDESKPVFRAGLNYQLGEYTFLRSSWGQGYRYPTIAERYISTTLGAIRIAPNPTVQSETGWTAEIGIKQGFQIGGMKAFADLALYQSEYQNMLEFVLVGIAEGFQAQNVGNTRIKGVDLSVSGQGRIGGLYTTILTGYTYIDPRFQDFTQADADASSVDYNILKYRSKHLFKIDLETTWKKLSLGVSVQHASEQEAIDAIFLLFIPGLIDFRAEHGGFILVDARLRYEINKSMKASLLLRNLGNAEYSLRPGLLEAPRSIGVRLDFSF